MESDFDSIDGIRVVRIFVEVGCRKVFGEVTQLVHSCDVAILGGTLCAVRILSFVDRDWILMMRNHVTTSAFTMQGLAICGLLVCAL